MPQRDDTLREEIKELTETMANLSKAIVRLSTKLEGFESRVTQLNSRLDKLETRIEDTVAKKEHIVSVERRIDNFVSNDKLALVEQRISSLENSYTWLTRTLFVTILGLLATAFKTIIFK